MIHRIVFCKLSASGIASTESLFVYALLVAENPHSRKKPKEKLVAILPLGDDAPQPAELVLFVEATDELAALNSAKKALEELPGLKGHLVNSSWAAK